MLNIVYNFFLIFLINIFRNVHLNVHIKFDLVLFPRSKILRYVCFSLIYYTFLLYSSVFIKLQRNLK